MRFRLHIRAGINKVAKAFRTRKLVRYLKFFFILLFLIILASNILVRYAYSRYIYSDIDKIPYTRVGLLLGTSKFLKTGGINPYYQFRLNATVELLKKGKIKFIIVSGDNSLAYYNEPRQMQNDLVKMGVDPKVIYLDYAGFRTLDSIIRAKKVFGQHKLLIISQAFHNQRAVFIARQKGIEAIAFNARDVKTSGGLKVQFREIFARVLLMVDLFLTNKQPKYLGEQVLIGN
jgi:SanA protein